MGAFQSGHSLTPHDRGSVMPQTHKDIYSMKLVHTFDFLVHLPQ